MKYYIDPPTCEWRAIEEPNGDMTIVFQKDELTFRLAGRVVDALFDLRANSLTAKTYKVPEKYEIRFGDVSNTHSGYTGDPQGVPPGPAHENREKCTA